MVTRAIERAQNQGDGQNFSIRKHLLEYAAGMTKQRETIYSQRDMVLDGVNIKSKILEMLDESIDSSVVTFLSDVDDKADWNIDGLRNHYLGWLTTDTDLRIPKSELKKYSKDDIANILRDKAHTKYD